MVLISLHLSNSIIHINKSPTYMEKRMAITKGRRFIDTSEEHIESGSDEQIHLDLIDEDKAQEKISDGTTEETKPKATKGKVNSKTTK